MNSSPERGLLAWQATRLEAGVPPPPAVSKLNRMAYFFEGWAQDSGRRAGGYLRYVVATLWMMPKQRSSESAPVGSPSARTSLGSPRLLVRPRTSCPRNESNLRHQV